MAEKKQTSVAEKILPFVRGGLAGCIATAVIQPVDMIKVQIQINAEAIGKAKVAGTKSELSTAPGAVAKQILKTGGVSAFYDGQKSIFIIQSISAAFTRQIFYTTSRFGIYESMFKNMKEKKGRNLTFAEKSLCSAVAGFIGSVIGTPPDLALIRMQADKSLPLEQRRNYKGVGDAFKRIVAEEGFLKLWSGCTPTVVRAVVLNFGMLGPYDQAKEFLNRTINGDVKKDTMNTQLLASAIAGFSASFLSLPFDNAKTKLQKQVVGKDGSKVYANIFDCILKTSKNEGVVGLWAGYPTFYARIAPHVMMTLLLQDVFKKHLDPLFLKKH